MLLTMYFIKTWVCIFLMSPALNNIDKSTFLFKWFQLSALDGQRMMFCWTHRLWINLKSY